MGVGKGSVTGSPGAIIDAWMQHPSSGFVDSPMFEPLRRWSHDRLAKVPVEWTLKQMDEAGVRCGMPCAWWGPTRGLITNDDVATLVEKHPDRFVGIASVDLYRPLQAVRELRRCVRELGFGRLRIDPRLWDLPPYDRRYYPLHAECCELDVPFCLQVGHTAPLRRAPATSSVPARLGWRPPRPTTAAGSRCDSTSRRVSRGDRRSPMTGSQRGGCCSSTNRRSTLVGATPDDSSQMRNQDPACRPEGGTRPDANA
jgi:hypothetical protein